jgi:hypothetical protein
MKKYLIPTVAVILVLVVAWTAFGQAEESGRQRGNTRGRFQNMSEEERAKMRERFQNMSAEDREKLRAQMRQRGGPGFGGFMGGQGQEEAIKVIEEQLAKLKEAQITLPQSGFINLPQEERAKIGQKMAKTFQDRQKALQTIIAQVAKMQGRRQSAAGGGQFMIINTSDLAPIQAAAKKEKAEETTQLLQRLIARGRGPRFGGRGGRGTETGQRPQDNQRGNRAPRPEGGQGGRRQRPEGGGQRNREQRNR